MRALGGCGARGSKSSSITNICIIIILSIILLVVFGPSPWKRRDMKKIIHARGSAAATEHGQQAPKRRKTVPAVGSVAATTLKRGTVTLTYNAQTSAHIEEAHADRANDTWEHLQRKLAEFLTNVVREACASADCEVIVADALKEFQGAATAEGSLFYDATALALHKKMWDIVTRDKFGIPKHHNFSEWCQWIATHSAATEHAAASSSATEHADVGFSENWLNLS